jgi:hypothetical protein
METQSAFGRRSGTVKTPLPPGKTSGLSDEQRAAIRKVLWASPLIVVLSALPIILTKLPSTDCGSKPAAERGLFEINWCQAGLAAARGAAQGVAVGAGARTVPNGPR